MLCRRKVAWDDWLTASDELSWKQWLIDLQIKLRWLWSSAGVADYSFLSLSMNISKTVAGMAKVAIDD